MKINKLNKYINFINKIVVDKEIKEEILKQINLF